MRWEDEQWIKLYVRDTPTTASWEWQTRAIWPEIMRKLDGAGLLHVGGKGARALAALIRFPADVVAVGLAELVADGTVTMSPEGVLCAPNFLEAQRARTSDKVRKASQRERDRDAAVANHAKLADVVSHGVTAGHTASHGVTNRLEEIRLEETRGDEISSQVATGALENPTPAGGPIAVEPGKPRRHPEPSDEAKACGKHLLEAIRSHTPDFKGDNEIGWARDLDLAIRCDARTPEQLTRAIDWVHRNPAGAFWRANILSGKKLRAQFETLRVRAREQNGSGVSRPRGLTGDDLLEAAARMRAEEEKQHGHE